MPWFKQRDVALISSDSVQDVQPSNIEGFPRPIHMLAINSLGLPMIDVAVPKRRSSPGESDSASSDGPSC